MKSIIFNILLITCIISQPLFAINPANDPVIPYKIKTVVLDAGHGGHDSGCKGSSHMEKHVALKIVLKLGKYIEENYPDVKVIYTRKTDVFIELNERANIANRNKADLFISVHCNANDNKSAYGTETFVMGLHRSDANLDVAKRENSVIMLEDDYKDKYNYDPKNPASHILFSLYSNAYLEQSISFATKVETEFTTRVKRNSRGVKQAGFLVLYKTAMPSVLIESGFLTNRNEEEFLSSDNGQDLIASAIYRAFKQYKEEMEGEVKMIVDINDEKTEPSKDETKVLLASTTPVPAGKSEVAEPAKKDAIEFRVQFMATNKNVNIKNHPYSQLDDIHTEKLNNGMVRYFSGRYYSPEDAKGALKTVKAKGFKDAFLTAYQNGEQINVVEALKTK